MVSRKELTVPSRLPTRSEKSSAIFRISLSRLFKYLRNARVTMTMPAISGASDTSDSTVLGVVLECTCSCLGAPFLDIQHCVE